MVKIFKMIMICTFGSAIMSSCLKKDDARTYIELYSVIKSSTGNTYFSSDDGINLYPSSFNPQWGKVGDRVLVGFYYNPYQVAESTTNLNINVERLYLVQTCDSALPFTVDTVGSGVFFHKNDNNQDGIFAWAMQNYLTVLFYVRYSDETKHTFGFIEEPELFKHDTLFLSMWHNAKEENKTTTSRSHIALNLANYEQLLSVKDSTVISIKYRAENLNSSTANDYIYNVKYYKKYNNKSID
ncbi:MAG: hypothetical protein LBS55_11455 [Prevotellaceae bacterium]|jgi:hypothetical protein|nr:hypothetical protein [Prevotellaceae bacterium]